MRIPFLILLCLILSNTSPARTWFVEKDGSGDYTEIQEAVDASADGDTIRIGPGRFDDLAHLGYPGDDSTGVINLIGRTLTVIGSGESTIIGPEEMGEVWAAPHSYGAVTTDYSNPIHLEALRFEHLTFATLMGGSATMEDLTVSECWAGLYVRSGGGGDLRNCRIHDCLFFSIIASVSVHGYLIDEVLVTNSDGIDIDGSSSDITIRNSTFTDNEIGIQYAANSTGTIQNCTVTGGRIGINITNGSVVTIEDCEMRPALTWGLTVQNGSSVYGTRNVIHPGTVGPTIDLCASNISMSESHIMHGTGNSLEIWCTYNPSLPWFIDLRNNYWGTAEADSIASWISIVDDPGALEYLQYEPFHDSPVSTERRSMGEMKALFR